ncbi:MAG: carboxypeptidase regulatory-like domain-containing protein, partial [Phycisphaerae bacterium]
MKTNYAWLSVGLLVLFVGLPTALAQQTGSIRGVVYDRNYDLPVSGAAVRLAPGQQQVQTQEGSFLFTGLAAGRYTLAVSKPGYRRSMRGDVLVNAGQVTEVTIYLDSEVEQMDEFVVEELEVSGDEDSLLDFRFEQPALVDSVGEDFISQSGAGDAGDALRLVAGATVAEGKYAVIRGLPDRYVNSQLSGIRLPTADSEKRAVQLDQFPSDIIESVQVSKTFTPDQQGDASGGAVNVVIKGVPREKILGFSVGYGVNMNVHENRDQFLSHKGGDLDTWGFDGGQRDIQRDNFGQNWTGAVGSMPVDAPTEYNWSVLGGTRHEFNNGLVIGGLANFYYDRSASHFSDGVDDSYWVTDPGAQMTPVTSDSPAPGNDFNTSLYDVTRSSESVAWGALGVLGAEIPGHSVQMMYLYTRDAENQVALAEDTRGKEYYYPGYDPYDPDGQGNKDVDTAPYLRLQTLKYTERETRTLQFRGKHTLPIPEIGLHWPEVGLDTFWVFLSPEINWSWATSRASLNEPDKRQFGSEWQAAWANPGFPPFIPPSTSPATYSQLKPSANINLGNIQHVYKEVVEESDQYAVSIRLPFRQWTGHRGFFEFGLFGDKVHRTFDQETFANSNDTGPDSTWQADWTEYWSDVFPDQDHPIFPTEFDTDYIGQQEISAWYHMFDLPLCRAVRLIGGARYERTELSITNIPESSVTWFPPGQGQTALNPGDADVAIEQDDILPVLGFVFQPFDQITIRGSRTETIARQTFKELTPIQQQEYLGADVFIGNPELQISALKNYDLRFDYRPNPGSLISVSWFHKKITDPIEYVQQYRNFTYYTTPVNYPEGELTGWEFELRQDLGAYFRPLAGLAIGANATFIDSEVTLPKDEVDAFQDPGVKIPLKKRDMLNAPEHLYNLYLTYDLPETGTKLGVFYTVRGDTLVAGPGISENNFIPGVYETEYGTLNFTLS